MNDDNKPWTSVQKKTVAAAFLGWALDAFDFFLMVFVLKDIAQEFHSSITEVSIAITLTLAARPVGAFVFGRIADRYGRRPALMIDIALFAVLDVATAFAPNLAVLLVLRALFGIAMGGEWGVGAALAFETIPARSRGLVSGLLQAGYPTGYLLAALTFGTAYAYIGWRGMFIVGALPALLVWYIRSHVGESPAWQQTSRTRAAGPGFVQTLTAHWKLALYAIVLMTAFNFFSHGTQDLYPTFLREQHHFDVHTVSLITITLNVGAIVGGLMFGALSERIGRRRAIAIAALIALPVLPLWAYSTTPLWLAAGAFLMQISVQGAWGVIPAHLNEMAPATIRATFPGLVYQLGNLLASGNATIQSAIAHGRGGDYAYALAIVAAIVAVVIAVLILTGSEWRGVDMAAVQDGARTPRPAAAS
ncbi:MAG: MFS transporter [Proteobacteria bacterium]|nr:MFS transporter [Pseudomonadota bacterium]